MWRVRVNIKPILPRTSANKILPFHSLAQIPNNADTQTQNPEFDYEIYNKNMLIKALSQSNRIEEARRVFDSIPHKNPNSWNVMLSALIKCGKIWDARQLFDKMPVKNAISWTTMMGGLARSGNCRDAFRMFSEMQKAADKDPDHVSFMAILNACGQMPNSLQTSQVHALVYKKGFLGLDNVQNTLLDSYAKCGEIDFARYIFDEIDEKSSVTFNALISGYAKVGMWRKSLGLYKELISYGHVPSRFAIAGALSACTGIGDLQNGSTIHATALKTGFIMNVFVGNAIMDMYSKCGELGEVRKVFDEMPYQDEVSSNVMFSAYVWNGQEIEALGLFKRMWGSGFDVSKISIPTLFNACASINGFDQGRQLHGLVVKAGVENMSFVYNSLVDFYGKCKCIDDAFGVFSLIQNKCVVSWNSIISSCSLIGRDEDTLKLFTDMLAANVRPDECAYAGVLKGCANLTAIEHGRQVHDHMLKSGYGQNLFSASALLYMYAKCGCIEDACSVFSEMSTKNVVSWNAMIYAYAINGQASEALGLFDQMLKDGTMLNNVTLICVLAACSHGGLVNEGCNFFYNMERDYSVVPSHEHYSCMIDLLSRAGRLKEAENLLDTMPFQPDKKMWMCLLGGCRTYGDVDLGRKAAEALFKCNPQDSAPYVVLFNIYAGAGMWDDAAKIKKLMRDRGAKKVVAYSWVDCKDTSYSFVSDDRSHPQAEKIYSVLKCLDEQIRKEGYVPDTRYALHDYEEESKEYSVCHHSERIAVAYGHMTTPRGMPIRIVKNLRACGDCHSAIKFMSKVVGRDIVIRDANRFHHFRHGKCSCGDYW